MRRFVSHISNKELDRDLELNYFGARYYQPEFPRFLSPDPVGSTPEVPISWNRYLYCRNDPVNFIDPDGRAIVHNNTNIDLVVSGNAGIGHGEGAQEFGVVPAGSVGGGADNSVT